ncbi:MAG: hypothetical protein EPO02_13375 [Nitrospirae bacterium]|nr:MAG: hypothetical protein EPO02_13375 [Nitrospirota bacterium]
MAKPGKTITKIPISIGDLFGSSKVRARTIATYCPFCSAMVKALQKGYLMVCKQCHMRID